ncbi:Nesprin-2 [Xenoophorus captivus]|uniref:Nesprin-2 n=2 Tax=Goodeidae TaxID=28758 RepID=A0ABV0R993_9TELE
MEGYFLLAGEPPSWSRLFSSLVRKLKETLVTVQQLDKNMSNLRTWLSCIEAELARPVVYSVCHNKEIHKKLAEQQVGKG